MSLTPAFGYLRVSGRAQIDGDGFPRQRAAIQAHAAASGLRIVRWYEEKGVSGKTEWENRPAWMEMLDELGSVKHIAIEKLDRLARDLVIQERIMTDLQKRGVSLLSAAEPDIASDDPSRVLIRQIFGVLAQYERAIITAKMRAAKVRMRARGERAEGRKPYGHDDPEEAEILAWMRECKQAGQSSEAIARSLNDLGRVTRYGKPWIGATVQKIVRRKAPVLAQ